MIDGVTHVDAGQDLLVGELAVGVVHVRLRAPSGPQEDQKVVGGRLLSLLAPVETVEVGFEVDGGRLSENDRTRGFGRHALRVDGTKGAPVSLASIWDWRDESSRSSTDVFVDADRDEVGPSAHEKTRVGRLEESRQGEQVSVSAVQIRSKIIWLSRESRPEGRSGRASERAQGRNSEAHVDVAPSEVSCQLSGTSNRVESRHGSETGSMLRVKTKRKGEKSPESQLVVVAVRGQRVL